MDLRPYVETIHRQLIVAAEAGGDEARVVAERLTAAVDSTVRLALQDALVAAAEEITCELAPSSVELRLRGREPEFVVRQPAGFGADSQGTGRAESGSSEGLGAPGTSTSPGTTTGISSSPSTDAAPVLDAEEGGTARVNLRIPDQLKARAEQAAAIERLSLNTWVVKAVAAALERAVPPKHDGGEQSSRRRYVGWAR